MSKPSTRSKRSASQRASVFEAGAQRFKLNAIAGQCGDHAVAIVAPGGVKGVPGASLPDVVGRILVLRHDRPVRLGLAELLPRLLHTLEQRSKIGLGCLSIHGQRRFIAVQGWAEPDLIVLSELFGGEQYVPQRPRIPGKGQELVDGRI